MIADNVLQSYIDQVFNKFDKDRSGTLDPAQLADFFNDVYAMMGQNVRVNNQQANDALRAIDKDYDGKASKL